MTLSFDDYSQQQRNRIELSLNQLLQSADQPWAVVAHPLDTEQLYEAMRYSVLGGGKRLRAMLVYASYESIKQTTAPTSCDHLAQAMECIHAYSLIHDDLPAMDDDDLRRGKPSNHIKFGEANAILAGDALNTLAFECIANSGLGANQLSACVKVLASASGPAGMIGGQFYDLRSEGKQLSQTQLQNLHQHKTGALIRAAVQLGAIAADADEFTLAQLDTFACKVGLAFQVIDDILDIEGDTQVLGKPSGADLGLDKATYPALMGLDAAKAYAKTLHEEAVNCLKALTIDSLRLQQLADYIIIRKH